MSSAITGSDIEFGLKRLGVEADMALEVHSSLNSFGNIEGGAVEKGLKNSLYSLCVQIDNELVGMARIVGDGSTCFYIQDVIVKPGFQKMGIGKKMMEKIMGYIAENASSGAIVGLMSAKGKEEFYEKFGFWRRPNENFGHGMMQFWRREE